MKLRSRLAEQKLLIILDDLWEETVLQKVLVPGKGVKYLITSQRRDIFIPAKKIKIRRPTNVEARSIMANYTDGLPIPGQFPPNIQTVTDDIIGKLEYHPLSLANFGISINSSWATHAKQWEVISANLHLHLDENDLRYPPPAYDRDYSLPVRASMMLMVESLSAEEKQLLFVMALLGGQRLPEPLVKYFYWFIQKTGFALKYNNLEKLLEDKSLIEKFTDVEEDMSLLDCHRLRSHYIRDTKTHEVKSLGSQILIASGSQDVSISIERGGREETLVAILGFIYYDPVFKSIVRSTLESHATVLNGGVMPKSLNMWTDIPEYVKYKTDTLVCLLNVDNGEEVWKKQAHEYAKKIIIKFICRGKLDDGSMASLLKHPQTTSVACTTLRSMYRCHWHDYYAHDITFSIAYPEIMETLLALLHDNGISTKRRAAVMSALLEILDFESKDTILVVGAQYRAVLAMHSKPEGQVAVMNVLWQRISYGRGYRIFTGSPGLLEDLTGVLLFGRKDPSVPLILNAANAIENIVRKSTRLTLRVAAFPNAFQMLFDMFVAHSRKNLLQEAAGKILSHVTIVAENRIKFTKIQGIWEGLGAIIEGAWRKTRGCDLYKLEERASIALWILGNLTFEKDLRDTIASLPCVWEGLRFLQTAELSAGNMQSAFAYTRALIILYPNVSVAMPSSLNLQPLEEVLEATAARDERPSPERFDDIACTMYWSRVLAYILMGSCAESLSSLDHAQRHDLQRHLPTLGPRGVVEGFYVGYAYISLNERTMRRCRVFLQAMLEDYTGAFQTASTLNDFALNGVLKRLSGDLQGALDNLNIAAEKRYAMFSADILKQRGYVKYLLDDEAGARKDAEMAQQIAMEEEELGRQLYELTHNDLFDLKKLPVSYLGFSFYM